MLKKVSRLFVCLVGLMLATLVCAPRAGAQSLSLGSISIIGGGGQGSCSGFSTLGSPGYRAFDPSMQQCFTAQVNCPNADPLQFIYGYWSPQGTPVGTIVTLTGDGGTYASTPAFSDYYIPAYEAANYEVVEVAWGVAAPGIAWEIANSGNNSTTTPSILNAACRVATFIHYVKNNSNLWTSGTGMCAHADSGGAGGLAYALTWYGEAQDLNKVLLENGPVFSRIDLGCDVPNGNTTTVCAPGTTQTGCNTPTWPPDPPSPNYSLEYVTQDAGNVNLWSGNTGPACANGQGNTTTYNKSWYSMSILSVNQPVSGSFNYPHTQMSAWLCQSVSKAGASLNNSTAQGGEYYAEFTQQSQAGGSLSVNGVVCTTSEDIEEGTTVYNGANYNGQSCVLQNGQQVCNNAWQALINDMIQNPSTACSAGGG
jgi:hypothetical protein